MTERLTLIQIATRAMEGIGIPAPSSVVVTTSDDNAKKVVQCIYDVATMMMDRHNWQSLKKLGTFSTIADESQGDIRTLFPDWRRFIDDTMWNATLDRKIYGPVSDQVWREAKTLGRVSSSNKLYRVFADELYLYDQDTASETINVEYISSYWIKSGLNRTGTMTTNSDISLLHGATMVAGVQATWLHREGQDSSEANARFQDSLKNQIAADGGRMIASLNAPRSQGRTSGMMRGDIAITGY